MGRSPMAMIASGCRLIDDDHDIALGRGPMNRQHGPAAPMVLGPDVWLGVRVRLLKGGDHWQGAAVVAAAVVTKSVPVGDIRGIRARRSALRS